MVCKRYEKGVSMEKELIEKKALETIEKMGIKEASEEVDIIALAKSLGFEVGNASLDEDDDGFILVNENEEKLFGLKTNKLIGVNSARPLSWKRFIIAHEIGHYILHYESQNKKGMYAHRDHRNGRSDDENAADYFAANILMPKDRFAKSYTELKNKQLEEGDVIVLLAEKYLVPQKAAERRIGELELVVNE